MAAGYRYEEFRHWSESDVIAVWVVLEGLS